MYFMGAASTGRCGDDQNLVALAERTSRMLACANAMGFFLAVCAGRSVQTQQCGCHDVWQSHAHPPSAMVATTSATPIATIAIPVRHGTPPAWRPSAWPAANRITSATAFETRIAARFR